MPLPAHLTAAHLRAGTLPLSVSTDPQVDRAAVVATLDAALLRLDLRADLLDAWHLRLPLLPRPPRTRTLQETVQAARAKLREERLAADRVEVDNRRFVVAHLREGLG